MKKWLDFGRNPDHHLDLVDPGISKSYGRILMTFSMGQGTANGRF